MALVLKGGTVVDLQPVEVRVRDVVMEGGVVVSRDPAADDEVLDCSGTVIWPGMVCGHTHLYSGLARGMPLPRQPTRSFVQILEEVWWKLDVALDEETLYLSALCAAMEALKAGTTTLFDHHESPRFIDGSLDVVAQALRETGLRGVLCYGATDRHGEPDGLRGVAESTRFIEKVRHDRMLRGMVGLHAPFTVGDATLHAAVAGAKAFSAGIHVHASEALSDEVHSNTRHGVSTITRLARAGALTAQSLVAHAVHVDEAAVAELAKRDTPVVHNPRSNANNAVGYQQPRRFRGPVALGTDGMDGDMVAELRSAWRAGRRQYGPSESADVMAMLSQTFALARRHFDHGFGALTAGSVADAVITSYDPPTPLHAATVFGHLVFGPSPWPVRDVVVDGRVLLRSGAFTQLDEAAIKARARDAAVKLWSRL